MKKDTKTLVITTIAVLAFILCVAGATYAYFQAQKGSGSAANVSANTATTDSIKFEDGKTLSIKATQDTFGEGDGNASDDTMVSAKVIANNTTNSATFHYYVYLDIQKNELEYTTEEETAELLLQVTDPNDKVVTSITGLNYVTVGGVSGFDITEETDLITIASNYQIKAEAAAPTAEKTDEWEVKLVLVNLDSDQNANTGKQLTAKVLIQLEELTEANREITFTIKQYDGTTIETYTATKNMTWQEWVTSDYNTSGKYIASPHGIYYNNIGWYDRGVYRIKNESTDVVLTDKIIKDMEYGIAFISEGRLPDA